MTTPTEDQITSSTSTTTNNVAPPPPPSSDNPALESDNNVIVKEEEEEEHNAEEGVGSKRHRPRKHKMYTEICKQIEFYFSDANIMKNRLMQEKVLNSEYTDLAMFLDFNRIKKATTRIEDLQKALVTSDKLELSPDNTSVKRKVPFNPKNVKSDKDVEESTIYVENVPRHVDHEWLETIFQSFGPIAYISLPKFKNTHQPKGFAFIEFDTPETASGCVEAYKGEGACLPSDMDPAALMSIQTFSEEQEATRKKKIKIEATDQVGSSTPSSSACSSRKRRHLGNDQNGKETPPDQPKKIKFEVKVEEGSPEEESNSKFTSPSEVESNSNDFGSNIGDPIEDTEASSKSKRKRKRNKTKKSAEEKLEGDSIHLKVMTKKAWRQLRNRYLNLQRQNMSKLKKQLRDQYLREQHYKNCMKQEAEDPGMAKSHVIEIDLDSPAESVEAFKKQIQVDLAGESEEEAVISGFIKFVDYDEGALQAYVRFGEDDCFTARIQNFIQNAEKVFRSARILTVYEAKDYKDRVLETLKLKRKDMPRNRVRGKDRLLKAAAKSSSHIRFDAPPAEEIKEEEEEEEMDVADSGNREVKVENDDDSEVSNEPVSTTTT